MSCQNRAAGAARTTLLLLGLTLLGAGCAAELDSEEASGASSDEIRVVSTFTSRGTGYYPSSSALEGGFNDRAGKKLRTLQQFLAGNADYVSVAMDTNAFRYGTRLRIKELDAKYGRSIVFRVVDTGSAFRGKGRSRIDICTANRSASLDSTVNGTLHLEVIDETGGPASTPTGNGTSASSGSGRACSSDGACNPGDDGSGEICTAGICVAGCRSQSQCPGAKSCVSGQCR